MPTMQQEEQTQDFLAKNTVGGEINQQNPAQAPGKTLPERQRIPMTVPVSRLEVAEIPGFHLHWFRGDPARIARAQQAGYEFVSHEEVDLNNLDLGGTSAASGNTDMGSRVSVISGEDLGSDGQPGRLYLMKIRNEYWEEGQKVLEDRNDEIAAALRGGKVGAGMAGGETERDKQLRYTRDRDLSLFTKNKNRKPQTHS